MVQTAPMALTAPTESTGLPVLPARTEPMALMALTALMESTGQPVLPALRGQPVLPVLRVRSEPTASQAIERAPRP
jgi:hypothetical protein